MEAAVLCRSLLPTQTPCSRGRSCFTDWNFQISCLADLFIGIQVPALARWDCLTTMPITGHCQPWLPVCITEPGPPVPGLWSPIVACWQYAHTGLVMGCQQVPQSQLEVDAVLLHNCVPSKHCVAFPGSHFGKDPEQAAQMRLTGFNATR